MFSFVLLSLSPCNMIQIIFKEANISNFLFNK